MIIVNIILRIIIITSVTVVVTCYNHCHYCQFPCCKRIPVQPHLNVHVLACCSLPLCERLLPDAFVLVRSCVCARIHFLYVGFCMDMCVHVLKKNVRLKQLFEQEMHSLPTCATSEAKRERTVPPPHPAPLIAMARGEGVALSNTYSQMIFFRRVISLNVSKGRSEGRQRLRGQIRKVSVLLVECVCLTGLCDPLASYLFFLDFFLPRFITLFVFVYIGTYLFLEKG